MPKNKSIFFEFIDFMKTRKRWWLTPILILMLIIGFMIVIGNSAPVSPFIYAMF